MTWNHRATGITLLAAVLSLAPVARGIDGTLDLAGVAITPHVGTPGVRFRQRPLAPLDARVQLFMVNHSAEPVQLTDVLFNGKNALEHLKAGTYDVDYKLSAGSVHIRDTASKVAVYVASVDPERRSRLETRRAALVQFEEACEFDPARNDADFSALAALLQPD